jgi:hypothetical protein
MTHFSITKTPYLSILFNYRLNKQNDRNDKDVSIIIQS